jgi:hypothetical protein
MKFALAILSFLSIINFTTSSEAKELNAAHPIQCYRDGIYRTSKLAFIPGENRPAAVVRTDLVDGLLKVLKTYSSSAPSIQTIYKDYADCLALRKARTAKYSWAMDNNHDSDLHIVREIYKDAHLNQGALEIAKSILDKQYACTLLEAGVDVAAILSIGGGASQAICVGYGGAVWTDLMPETRFGVGLGAEGSGGGKIVINRFGWSAFGFRMRYSGKMGASVGFGGYLTGKAEDYDSPGIQGGGVSVGTGAFAQVGVRFENEPTSYINNDSWILKRLQK